MQQTKVLTAPEPRSAPAETISLERFEFADRGDWLKRFVNLH